MTAEGKILININADLSEKRTTSAGELRPGEFLIADTTVQTVAQSDLSVVEIRMIMPSRQAEDLLLGMVAGETELAIGKMSPVLEREQC